MVHPLRGRILLQRLHPFKGLAMGSTFTAITKKDGDWWIGWIAEVPGVNAQEATKEELISSLREILAEALEFNRSEARQAAENNYTEELVTL
jgi:predicted RNase H-like HicB family nuclease